MALSISNTMPTKSPLLSTSGTGSLGSMSNSYSSSPFNLTSMGSGIQPTAALNSSTLSLNPQPKAPTSGLVGTGGSGGGVNLSGVPTSAITALSTGGLTGNELAMAQKSLADHYASIGGNTGGAQQTGTTGGGLITPTAPPAPAPSRGLFPSVVGSLATPGPTAMTNQGIADYEKAVGNLSSFRQSAADTQQAINSAPTSARVMQGRNQQVQQANAQKEAALAAAVTQAQAEVGFGQQQQNLNQTALTSAAGFSAPQLGSIGQVPFNPVEQGQGAILGSGAPGGLQGAAATLGGYNAAVQNAQTQGTAYTGAAAQGFQQSLQAYQTASTSYSQAQGQAQNLQTTMAGINGINSQYANTAINKLKNQFGSAQYSSFITALSESQQAYINLLDSVGAATPTVNGEQATAILNPNSTPAQINAAIETLNQAAYAKLKPLYDQAQTYHNALNGGGGGGGAAPAAGAGGSASGFGWNG